MRRISVETSLVFSVFHTLKSRRLFRTTFSYLPSAARTILCCLLWLIPATAEAASSFEVDSLGEKFHVTADRTLYHSRERVYEAFGHVVVSAQGQRMASDYLWLDDNTKDIKARGNVTFVDKSSTVECAELHFNLTTSIGSIFYGKVSNDLYSLRGQLIRRVGEDHYLTTEGEYTTCKDCPESWKLSARNVDLTVDGYAYLSSVFLQIKDVPTLYLPYLIVPVKTRRQSGLLFPRMGGDSTHGFVFVQPGFVALSEHQDMTLGFGRYSNRGLRYEFEHRYRSFDGITGQFNGYFTKDRNNRDAQDRGAIKTTHEWPFHKNFQMRWRLFEVKDRDYIYEFVEDLNVLGRPAIESNAVAQAPFNDFFMSVEGKRYRNLLYSSPLGFDGGMVQAYPTVHAGVKERSILGPVNGSFYGRYDRFTRINGAFTDLNGNRLFDPDFGSTPVTNPERLREAHRLILSPELSMPFRAGPYFSVVPSAGYNEIRYDFSLPKPNATLDSTATRYFQLKLDLSTTLQRVYDYDGERVSKVEHQLTPFVNFSYIPKVHNNPDHQFQRQLQFSDGLFDQYDIVPLTNSTNFLRFPQGQSVYYGFTSRVIRKMKSEEEMPRSYPYDLLPARKPREYPKPLNRKQELAFEQEKLWDEHDPHYERYQEIWNLNVAQAFDAIDARNNPDDRARAFSYLLGKSHFSLDDKFTHDLEYRYYPRIIIRPEVGPTERLVDKHWVTTSLTWYWKKLQNLRKTRTFQRSVALNYANKSRPSASHTIGGTLNWSFNDFINLSLTDAYDFIGDTTTGPRNISWGATAILTHPSECWGLALRYEWARFRSPNSQVGFQVLLNLTGTGFYGATGGGEREGAFGGI